ncbi:hypothetical protein JW890_01290 [candidate division WOR-3 bacterium]|nr:hypothetical protein [candidate division WOR-3 bacterium]
MLTALYFFPSLFLYAILKGVIIKISIPARIIVSSLVAVLFLILFTASLKFNTILLILTQIYLATSLLEYLLLNFEVALSARFFDSYIYIKSEQVVVRYSVFKPLLIIAANILLFVKKAPLLGLKDDINLSVLSRKNVDLNIKI